ncbi:MAG: hypothetical protein ACXWK5_06800 [Myxococcaceae bacterium]
MRAPLLRKVLAALTLWSSAALAGDASLVVLILGPPATPPAPTPLMPGQTLRRPTGVQLPARSPPGLVVLVDGKARVLVDPASGSVGSARSLGQNLTEVGTVLLTSMRPAATADLPVFLTDSAGPAVTVHLLGPGGGGRWPSTGRWAEVLFGGSGLYRTAGSRVPRLLVDEVKSGAERRVTLPGGVELRARGTPGPDGPASVYRLSREGASVVLAGEIAPAGTQALATFAAGAPMVVASVPTLAAVRALGEVVSTAKVGALLVTAAGDEVRADPEEARRLLAGPSVSVTWTSSGALPVPGPPPAAGAEEIDRGCRSDAQCGPGQICMGCGGDSPNECVIGCRSKTDCPVGQACLKVQCIRCPCPAQCSGGG